MVWLGRVRNEPVPDGYVDQAAFAPSPTLFRHFIEEAQGQAGNEGFRSARNVAVG
jgi:hypothetical protein